LNIFVSEAGSWAHALRAAERGAKLWIVAIGCPLLNFKRYFPREWGVTIPPETGIYASVNIYTYAELETIGRRRPWSGGKMSSTMIRIPKS